MRVHGVVGCGITLILLAGHAALRAQTASAPTTYTVTSTDMMSGPNSTTKTYRLGSKVVVDIRRSASVVGGASYDRTFFDLKTVEQLTWDPVYSEHPCVKETFSGHWNDPFESPDGLIKQGAKVAGAETIHGFTTKIMQTAPGPNGVTKAWVDTKTNMLVKVQVIPPSGAPVTIVEVTDVSLTAPPASIFVTPTNCAPLPAHAPTNH